MTYLAALRTVSYAKAFNLNICRDRLAITAFISAFALAGTVTPALADINLVFGTYAADKPTEIIRQFRPILTSLERALTKKLGQKVHIKTQVASSYDRGISNLVEGRADFARFGPASYIFSKQSAPGISLLAMENVKGRKSFKGIICVHKDSPITALSQLKGRTFAFGSSRSTIGRYLSQLHLLKAGVPASALKSFEYLGRHDKVGAAVARQAFAAGALKESTFRKLLRKQMPLKAILSFDNVSKPWIARAGLPKTIRLALKHSLLEIHDPAALKPLKKDGFFPASDSDYNVIREAIMRNPDFFK